jgi:hypothetical protein
MRTNQPPTVDDLVVAVERAEAEAFARHEAGTCHLSEWSCSYCEAAAR